jgi:hypothetical protein
MLHVRQLDQLLLIYQIMFALAAAFSTDNRFVVKEI